MFLDSVVASRNLLEAVKDLRPMRVVLVSSFGTMGVAEMRRGAMIVKIGWPLSAAADCAAWLRELLR